MLSLSWRRLGDSVLLTRMTPRSGVSRLASGLTADFRRTHRLGPEFPMPAAADDALAIFRFVESHASDYGIDPGKLALSGDSAGASLAASTAVAVANTPQRPAALLLFYPSLDQRPEAESLASRRFFSEGGPVTKSLSDWFASYALKGVRRDDPRVSPTGCPVTRGTASHDDHHRGARYPSRRRKAFRAEARRRSRSCHLVQYPGRRARIP